jgi:ABC-type polysaccharide/polyol phosphate transport system ATPase subunit
MPAIIECRGVGKCFTLRTSRYRLLKDRVLAEVRPHLRKTAKIFWVLRDVSLAVEPGEVLAIIGPNGAGKTTLFRIISGIFQPSNGSVHIRGRMAPLLALGVGFHDDLTGRENIYLSAALFGYTTREIRALEPAIIEFSELEHFIDAPTKTYSAGMQARLGFSIAAQLRPDIFLMDEVLAVGDEHFKEKCLAHLEKQRRLGRTLLIASHSLSFVEETCDRAALLMDGQVAALGPAKDVTKVYRDILAGIAAPS